MGDIKILGKHIGRLANIGKDERIDWKILEKYWKRDWEEIGTLYKNWKRLAKTGKEIGKIEKYWERDRKKWKRDWKEFEKNKN